MKKNCKTLHFEKNFFWIFLSSGALIGFLPFCPGTFGALEGALFFWFFKTYPLSYQFLIIILFFIIGIISAHLTSNILNDKDPDFVIIDEIVGMWISLLGKKILIEIILAFILFRLIDIKKPFPIKKMENIPGGLGIMMDDVIAGILTNICVIFIITGFKICMGH